MSIHQRLMAAGIRISAGDDQPAARTECARLARVLIHNQQRVVGLVPAADHVAVPAVALQLGRALADGTGSPVGVIDAHGSWPGAREVEGPADAALFVTIWLLDNLALLTPRTFDIGAMLPKLNAAVRDEAAIFHHLVIDLTGFDHMGEHLSVMETLDGVIVLARSGRTRLGDLERWMRDIPAERNLGVLLTGV